MQRVSRLFAAIGLLIAFQVVASPSAFHTATITGTSATVQFTTAASPAVASTARAVWIQFRVPTGNSAVARIGDSSVSSTVGMDLPAGTGFFAPPQINDSYQLSTVYIYAANGDKVSVTWAD